MEPPPPLPPRSPAEGRRDQPPGRIRPSVLPPAATSTPSLAPSLALRALPLNRSESAKEGGNGGEKIPPPVPGAAAAGAARRGAQSCCRHRARSPARPHGGGADAAGRGAKTGSVSASAAASPWLSLPLGEPDVRAEGRSGPFGKDRGS